MGDNLMKSRLIHVVNILKEMYSLPTLSLVIFKENKNIYDYFTKPHPRYKIIQNKKWGVAIQEIPNLFEDYLKGKKKQALRTNRSKCLKKGYYFRVFPSSEFITEIMQINTSLFLRQGKPMSDSYTDKDEVEKWISDKPYLYGVFDKNNNLKAYAYVHTIGDVCVISRLLGHEDSLKDGVMYLLISETIHDLVEKKKSLGYPKYIMYDTFFGANPGLRYFKERLGFQPFKIKWRLG